MAQPSPSIVASFNRILKTVGDGKHRKLRCIWGETDYGLPRWVIQCQLPDDIHAQCLEEFEAFHEERFTDKAIIGAEGQVTGHFRYDAVNPWVLIHIVEDNFFDSDDPRGYRVPAERDLSAVYHWMHDYKSVEDQIRAVREHNKKVEEKQRADRCYALADDIKNSRSLWELPEHLFVNEADQLPGTDLT